MEGWRRLPEKAAAAAVERRGTIAADTMLEDDSLLIFG
jgi:hypothetical protein